MYLGLVDSGKEYFACMSDAQDMGFSRGKLLGLFAQMIICGDITNVKDIWNGVQKKDGEEMDELEEKYPNGYKSLMMHFPPKMVNELRRKNPRFSYNYDDLPNDSLKKQVEQ